jgi:hypothetical protein
MKDRTIFVIVAIAMILFSVGIYHSISHIPTSQDPVIQPEIVTATHVPNPGIIKLPSGGEQEDDTEQEDD